MQFGASTPNYGRGAPAAFCASRPPSRSIPISRIPHIRAAAFLSAVLALLVFVSPSFASLTAPTLTGPAASVTVDALPTFTWSGVSGADHYVFQLGG